MYFLYIYVYEALAGVQISAVQITEDGEFPPCTGKIAIKTIFI